MDTEIERLREHAVYDPITGLIYRIKAVKSAKIGACGGLTCGGYLMCGFLRKRYLAHRLAWALTHGRWPVAEIDHINGIRTDNRLANLREVTGSQNMYNSADRKRNKTGTKGVFWDNSRKKYLAYISVNRKRVQLGRFDSLEDAVAVRKTAEIHYHGDYSRNGVGLKTDWKPEKLLKTKSSLNTGGVVGVVWDEAKKKWTARISVNGKQLFLGRFEDFDDAVVARKAGLERHFGEYKSPFRTRDQLILSN